MRARTHHLRYVALCASMLLALAVVAWVDEEVSIPVWKAMSVTPFAFAGTFLFNHFRGVREGTFKGKAEQDVVPPEAEARVANGIYLGTLALSVTAVAVAVLAPAYFPKIAWVVPVLAGSAGIHAQALT